MQALPVASLASIYHKNLVYRLFPVLARFIFLNRSLSLLRSNQNYQCIQVSVTRIICRLLYTMPTRLAHVVN